MFSQSQRLSTEGFKHIARSSQSFHTPYFVLLVRYSDTCTQSRYAVVVAKTVSQKAVIRNKIKRRVIGILKMFMPFFIKNADCVVYIKPQIINTPRENVINTFRDVLKKASLLST